MAPAARAVFAGTNQSCNYTVRVGLAKPDLQRHGGGGPTVAAEQVDVLYEVSSENLTVVMQLDPSVRSSRRVRGPSADFYELMAALDEQTASLPDTTVLSEQRRVPVYASVPAKPAGDYGADGPLTPVDPRYNETVDRFNDFFNFTGKKQGQDALGQECKDCVAFDHMLDVLCWPGTYHFDPIADPTNSSIEACVLGQLQPRIDKGINAIKDPFVSMGDEIGELTAPASNFRSLVLPSSPALRSIASIRRR
jgi:hypothetical protein